MPGDAYLIQGRSLLLVSSG